uniref:Uncharacterized protein n=1 Tax=Rhizochromulina marina TaxID=1034831 RepID=A0A7S2SG61_9STRA|eukprot:CAMPEP_0118967064 /NCGR_PEP_ID=MMETSP1173-20130426/4482_1 /TAXON_ID=1034831 /ORGANISM="Rhizochromulina marina cf, Strain CCMP1243" /LENGTH=242 /DNA_ID=CAMNT_0006915963 /DNA_START=43 /DNA_END=771 /DNA_ORIENTATION=-
MSRIVALLILAAGLAEGFTVPRVAFPGSRTAQRRSVVSMSDPDSWSAGSASPSSSSSPGGAIVPVNPDNIKYTVGLAGAATGLLVGGPTSAVLLAVLANYAASKDGDASQVINSAGQTVLQTYNLALKANDELKLTEKISEKLKEIVEESKAGNNGEAMVKISDALETITSKADEINDEYGLTKALQEVLVKAGDLSVEAIDAGLKFADENNLADKAKDAIAEASDNVRAQAKAAQASTTEK